MVNALAGRPIRPLWHLSREGRSLTVDRGCRPAHGPSRWALVSLIGGTVAERTIAPALKAGGRKARGFESLPFRSCDVARHPGQTEPASGFGCLLFPGSWGAPVVTRPRRHVSGGGSGTSRSNASPLEPSPRPVACARAEPHDDAAVAPAGALEPLRRPPSPRAGPPPRARSTASAQRSSRPSRSSAVRGLHLAGGFVALGRCAASPRAAAGSRGRSRGRARGRTGSSARARVVITW